MTRGAHRANPGRSDTRRRRPFTLVDELNCYFDTPAEPANVHLEMRIPGHLDQEAFREAAIAALMGNSRVSGRRAAVSPLSCSFSWEYPAELDFDPISFATFSDVTELARTRGEFIARSPSIATSPPVLLLLAEGPDCSHVILNAHHATMDGMSCLELFRDIGRRYRACTSADTGGAMRPVTAAEPTADDRASTAASLAALTAAASAGQPAPTAGPADHPAPTTAAEPAAVTPGRLAATLPARIAAERGGQRGCDLRLYLLPGVPVVPAFSSGDTATLNDALITALILAIGRWNAEHGRPRRQVRITVPINIRHAGQRPALGNLSRLVTVAALPPAPDAALEPVLRAVAAQVRRAREQPGPQVDRESRGLAALWCPTALKRLLVRAALRTVGPLVCDTVMLTNLGKVSAPPDFGQQGAVTLLFSAQAHMPRGISIGVVTAGRQPLIAMRYNRALLDEAAASRFLASYVAAIGELTLPADPGSKPSDPLNADWSSQASAMTVPAD
jgi:NRPS condensation-like uncharacterized protein